MAKILVVEDDERLRKVYQSLFEKNGDRVFIASDGEEALDILEKNAVDLMISDIMMPGISGIQLTQELRDAGYMFPIIIATAKDSLPFKEQGFKSGTDDYMVKPIDLNELLLRVGALLRRAQIQQEKRITVGDTTLLYDSLEVIQKGHAEVLPQKEFYVLFKLLSSPNKVFTRQQIMDDIWGLETESELRTVDVHINKLRERLQGNQDVEIVTARGLGYRAVKLHE